MSGDDLPNAAVAKCATAMMRLFKADAVLIVVCGGDVGQTIEYVVSAEAMEDWLRWAPKALRNTAEQIETSSAQFVATITVDGIKKPGQA